MANKLMMNWWWWCCYECHRRSHFTDDNAKTFD